MSELHWQILDEKQKRALDSLKAFSKYGILAGGTALALQLCHRKSYDLDIFLPNAVSKKFVYKVKQHFKKIETIVNTGDEFSFNSPFNVKISFVSYPYPPLYRTISTSYLRIYHWKDIILDKAHTIGRRGEWRDYIDLYFGVKNGFSLKNIIKGAKKKFEGEFSEKLFLSQLDYFGDIKDFTVEFIKEKVSQRQLKEFFGKEIEKLKLI